MTTMISEVYEAFRAAGVPDDKARKAAEVHAHEQLATKSDMVRVERALAVIKWMLALVVAAEGLPIIKMLFTHG